MSKKKIHLKLGLKIHIDVQNVSPVLMVLLSIAEISNNNNTLLYEGKLC